MHQIIVDNETGEVIADTPIQRKSSLHERSLVQIIAIALLSVLLILNLSYVADQNERINDLQLKIAEQQEEISDAEDLIESLKDVRSQLTQENQELKNQLDAYNPFLTPTDIPHFYHTGK